MIESTVPRQRQRFAGALPFLTLAVLAALVTLVIWGAWKAIASLESATAVAVVTTSATILLSVGSLIYSRRAEQQRTIEQQLREKKTPIYDEFIQWWLETLFHELLRKPARSEQEVGTWKTSFNQKIIPWAPDAFLKEYNRFMGMAGDDTDPIEIAFAFERLLYVLRQDLGHKNEGLGQGDLLRLFINDVDEHLPDQAADTS